jgi:2-isopropylmalate synthase
MGRTVLLYDTTLRDGSQGTGISFSLADKIDIARRLDGFGFDYVEGGWPGSNPKDEEFFEALKTAPLRRARLTAFGSTRHKSARAEQDTNLKGLVAAGTPAVAIFAKAWDFQVEVVLRTTLEQNLEMVRDSVGYLKAAGREVILDAEHFFDGYRANHEYALAVLAAAAEAGADWLVLCDTNGGALPGAVAEAVAGVVARFGAPVGIHAHNDGELAVANSLAAVGAGARQVQGTVNGYGERVGNANLCSGAAEPRAQGRCGVRRRRAPCRADGAVPCDRGDGQGRAQSAARLCRRRRLRPQGRRARPCRGCGPAHL